MMAISCRPWVIQPQQGRIKGHRADFRSVPFGDILVMIFPLLGSRYCCPAVPSPSPSHSPSAHPGMAHLMPDVFVISQQAQLSSALLCECLGVCECLCVCVRGTLCSA